MGLILHSGDAKNHMYQALDHAKCCRYQELEDEIELAEKALNEAHTVQTAFLQAEACGDAIAISALFVHAQDHLMTTISEMNLIKEIIDMRKLLDEKKD